VIDTVQTLLSKVVCILFLKKNEMLLVRKKIFREALRTDIGIVVRSANTKDFEFLSVTGSCAYPRGYRVVVLVGTPPPWMKLILTAVACAFSGEGIRWYVHVTRNGSISYHTHHTHQTGSRSLLVFLPECRRNSQSAAEAYNNWQAFNALVLSYPN